MGIIKHEEVTANGLQKSMYQYWFIDSGLKLALCRYEEWSRLTARHKWQLDGFWDNMNSKEYNTIQRDEIPGLAEANQVALKKFIEQITVEAE